MTWFISGKKIHAFFLNRVSSNQTWKVIRSYLFRCWVLSLIAERVRPWRDRKQQRRQAWRFVLLHYLIAHWHFHNSEEVKYICYNFVLSIYFIVFNPVVLLHFVQLVSAVVHFLVLYGIDGCSKSPRRNFLPESINEQITRRAGSTTETECLFKRKKGRAFKLVVGLSSEADSNEVIPESRNRI